MKDKSGLEGRRPNGAFDSPAAVCYPLPIIRYLRKAARLLLLTFCLLPTKAAIYNNVHAWKKRCET